MHYAYISKGCPKHGKEITLKSKDSKYNVRCCNQNKCYSCSYASCTSKSIFCYGKMNYNQAVTFCKAKRLHVCFQDELDSCCSTGCGYDNTLIWIGDVNKGIGNLSLFNKLIELFYCRKQYV